MEARKIFILDFRGYPLDAKKVLLRGVRCAEQFFGRKRFSLCRKVFVFTAVLPDERDMFSFFAGANMIFGYNIAIMHRREHRIVALLFVIGAELRLSCT